jgi:hypothetical protein
MLPVSPVSSQLTLFKALSKGRDLRPSPPTTFQTAKKPYSFETVFSVANKTLKVHHT